LDGQVGGLAPVQGVVEQFVALGEQRHQRPQLRIPFGQHAGDLLRAQIRQASLTPSNIGVQVA